MVFYESFMKFGFPDEDVFRIENDPLVISADGIDSCECIVHVFDETMALDKTTLIEAKSSSPKSVDTIKFEMFIDSVGKKFSDSLSLYNYPQALPQYGAPWELLCIIKPIKTNNYV